MTTTSKLNKFFVHVLFIVASIMSLTLLLRAKKVKILIQKKIMYPAIHLKYWING